MINQGFDYMDSLVKYGHSKGVAMGWYMAGCKCWDRDKRDIDYAGDVDALIKYDFQGVKFDACAPGQQNLTRYAELMQGAGKDFLVEQCHWGQGPDVLDDGTIHCPFNLYRSSGDITASWEGVLNNLQSVAGRVSVPHCWAYPDMLEVGNLASYQEDLAHFSAWCIVSSPLILGMDLRNETIMARAMGILSNPELLAVNQNWVGSSGSLVASSSTNSETPFVWARKCDPSEKGQMGWALKAVPGSLLDGPSLWQITATDGEGAASSCVDFGLGGEDDTFGRIVPCNRKSQGQIVCHNQNKTLTLASNGKCVDVSAWKGPTVSIGDCHTGQANQQYIFSPTGAWLDNANNSKQTPRRCMERRLGSPAGDKADEIFHQTWAKPQPNGSFAVFFVNSKAPKGFKGHLNFSSVPGMSSKVVYVARDLQKRVNIPGEFIASFTTPDVIDSHDSRMYAFTPSVSLPKGVMSVLDCEGVVGDGVHDDTVGIQTCINASFLSHSVLYFPANRSYLVSDSLTATQDVPGSDLDGINIVPARFHAHIIVGGTAMRGETRPRLVLAAHSKGFQNDSFPAGCNPAGAPKHVLKFTMPLSYGENENMNQMLRGLDFELRKGNPGAVAVHFHGAQGCTIQDVNVEAGGSLAGFYGFVGAGGSFVNVAVNQGRFGVLVRDCESEAGAALASSIFTNQTESGISWLGQSSMTIVGTTVRQGLLPLGPPIQCHTNWDGGSGQLVLVDSFLECGGDGSGVAVTTKYSFYAHNTYVKGCSSLLQGSPSLANGRWNNISDASFAINTDPRSLNIMEVAYINGLRRPGWNIHQSKPLPYNMEPPIASAQQTHSWNASFPSLDDPRAVNAMDQCGAIGDGAADDTAALQSCLDAHLIVLLPRGRFRITRSIELRNGGILLGLSPTHSQIIAASNDPVSLKAEATKGWPMVKTSTGFNAVAYVGITSFWHLPGVTTMLWLSQDSESLWLSNYETRVPECLWWDDYRRFNSTALGYGPRPACKPPVALNQPKTVVQGAGRFFNFVNDDDIALTGVKYRHLIVSDADGTNGGGRLRFYGLNLEHAQGEACAEIASKRGIDIYGLKIEGSNPILWVHDSEDFNLWGLGGSSDAWPLANGTAYYPSKFEPYPASLFRVERTTKYRFVNMIQGGRGGNGTYIHPITPLPNATAMRKGDMGWSSEDIDAIVASVWAPWPGYSVAKELWVQHIECDGPGNCTHTAPFEKPIMLARGHPELLAD